MFSIYRLIEPDTNRIRYVGKTVNTATRLSRHKRDALYGSTSIRKNAWLRSLANRNLTPIMEVIIVVQDDWETWERFYIRLYKSMGYDLVNSTAGGDPLPHLKGQNHPQYGIKRSTITKTKISEKAKQRWKDGYYDIHRKPIDEKWSIEAAANHRQRMIDYNSNKIVTETTKAKISAAQAHPIILFDTVTGDSLRFENARLAADHVGCKRSNINNRRRTGGLVANRYQVKFVTDLAQSADHASNA